MMGVGVKRALGLYRSCAPRQRLVAFAVTLSALLSGIAAPRVHAQTTWGVEVSPTTLSIDEGESLTYRRRCCTARSKSLTSLCRLQSHPAQYVSGIPSAAILLSISHPIRCSTRCLANVRARISGPMIAL